MTTPTPWHAVRPLSLVMSPNGRLALVADTRLAEGDAIEALIVQRDGDWKQLVFSAFDTVDVVSEELFMVFELLKSFPGATRIGDM